MPHHETLRLALKRGKYTKQHHITATGSLHVAYCRHRVKCYTGAVILLKKEMNVEKGLVDERQWSLLSDLLVKDSFLEPEAAVHITFFSSLTSFSLVDKDRG